MVSLDLVLSIVLLLCFILGMLRGFLLQAVALAAALIGFLAAWSLSTLMGILFKGGFLSSASSSVLLGTALFIVVHIVVLAIGRNLIKTRGLAFSKGIADRLFGGVFSFLEGAVILLLLVWFFDCIGKDCLERSERVRIVWNESRVCQLAHTHNPIAGLTPMRWLKGFFAAARDPEARSRLQGQPAYASMLMNERLRQLSDDVEIEEAMSRRDWISVLGDNRVRALLADETFRRDFSSVRWEMALEKVETPVEVHVPGLIPRPPPVQVSPETRTENRLRSEPSGLSRVVLKTGAVLHGAITKENPEGITIDVFVNGGVITMSVPRREIERMESTRAGSPHVQ